jgi:SAM-dependent methyltransferase
VVRDLSARGHRTTGVDASSNLIAAARQADPVGTYLHANATALPFEDAAFDLVVIYNALMDFDDMPGAVVEAARVLEPGGHLSVSVTHPVFNAGGFDGDSADAPFVIEGSYLDNRRRFEAVVEEDGVPDAVRRLGGLARGVHPAAGGRRPAHREAPRTKGARQLRQENPIG